MKKFLVTYRRLFFALAVACVAFWATACAIPTWLQDANSIIPMLVASATSILSFIAALTGNAVAAEVLAAISAWSTKVDAGLKNIEDLISQYNENPNDTLLQNIEGEAQVVVSDIGTFSSIVDVPTAISTKIQAVAQLILTQLIAWMSLLPAAKKSLAAGTVVTFIVPFDSKSFKSQVNAVWALPTGDAAVDKAAAKVKRL